MNKVINSLNAEPKSAYRLAVFVAALGYFVDIYDLLLFSMIRVPSLRALGVADSDLLRQGVLLINCQMAGLLTGGIFWGILGDKKGRLSVLFGSILLYSIANIANGFVTTIEAYAILRFIAGVGLAGELGAGITLVTELMPKGTRGWGTTFVATVGLFGAVFGGFLVEHFEWRTNFFVGGVMGIGLLLLRLGVAESGLFQKVKQLEVRRGNLSIFFDRADLFRKYLCIIIIGIPIWYVVGILVTFCPEFGKSFGMAELPSTAKAVAFCYGGTAVGDVCAGALSQLLKSRKKSILIFMLLNVVTVSLYYLVAGTSLTIFYIMCSVIGFSAGYWAMFVTVASEQFGTNIRSTITTTVPNFVRGSVILMTSAFNALQSQFNIQMAGITVGVVVIGAGFLCLMGIDETFHKDLEFTS